MYRGYLSAITRSLEAGMHEVNTEIKILIIMLAAATIVFGYLFVMYKVKYKNSLSTFSLQRCKIPVDVAVEDADLVSAKFVDKIKSEATIWAMSWALSRMFLVGFVMSLGLLLYTATAIL